jgi:thiol-disulfide isomerase/thioredoxin
MKPKNKYLSNISTGVLVAFVAAMFLFPSFKGKVMQGLMKVGLFQPNIPDISKEEVVTEFASNTEMDRILFKNNDGEVIPLSSLKDKVVFINFWATWCPPCIAEMPTIQKLYSEFKDNEDIVFMMVDVDNQREKSQAFMDKRKFDLPIYTPAGPIPSSYLGGAIPTTLVLNKQGEVVFKHEGMGDFSNEEFKTFIKQLLGE